MICRSAAPGAMHYPDGNLRASSRRGRRSYKVVSIGVRGYAAPGAIHVK
jgi:hypothetical protein